MLSSGRSTSAKGAFSTDVCLEVDDILVFSNQLLFDPKKISCQYFSGDDFETPTDFLPIESLGAEDIEPKHGDDGEQKFFKVQVKQELIKARVLTLIDVNVIEVQIEYTKGKYIFAKLLLNNPENLNGICIYRPVTDNPEIIPVRDVLLSSSKLDSDGKSIAATSPMHSPSKPRTILRSLSGRFSKSPDSTSGSPSNSPKSPFKKAASKEDLGTDFFSFGMLNTRSFLKSQNYHATLGDWDYSDKSADVVKIVGSETIISNWHQPLCIKEELLAKEREVIIRNRIRDYKTKFPESYVTKITDPKIDAADIIRGAISKEMFVILELEMAQNKSLPNLFESSLNKFDRMQKLIQICDSFTYIRRQDFPSGDVNELLAVQYEMILQNKYPQGTRLGNIIAAWSFDRDNLSKYQSRPVAKVQLVQDLIHMIRLVCMGSNIEAATKLARRYPKTATEMKPTNSKGNSDEDYKEALQILGNFKEYDDSHLNVEGEIVLETINGKNLLWALNLPPTPSSESPKNLISRQRAPKIS